MNHEMKAGFWRQRDSGKAELVGKSSTVSCYPWVGRDSTGALESWNEVGRVRSDVQSAHDLIEPWVDKPEWPKCEISEWIKFIAMDSDGAWYGYNSRPETHNNQWDNHNSSINPIPATHAPKWTGDWRQSLIERPCKQ